MGLSNQLRDVSGDSLPIILLAAAGGCVSYLRSILLFFLQSLRLLRLTSSAATESSTHLAAPLANLLFADQLSAFPSCIFSPHSDDPLDCVVCLSLLAAGDRVRRLGCSHIFHSECLDGWLGQMVNLSCPICRFPLASPPPAPEERWEDDEHRIEAELVAWLSSY